MLQFTKAYCGLFNEAGLPPKRQLTCFAVTPDAAIQPGQMISTHLSKFFLKHLLIQLIHYCWSYGDFSEL